MQDLRHRVRRRDRAGRMGLIYRMVHRSAVSTPRRTRYSRWRPSQLTPNLRNTVTWRVIGPRYLWERRGVGKRRRTPTTAQVTVHVHATGRPMARVGAQLNLTPPPREPTRQTAPKTYNE